MTKAAKTNSTLTVPYLCDGPNGDIYTVRGLENVMLIVNPHSYSLNVYVNRQYNSDLSKKLHNAFIGRSINKELHKDVSDWIKENIKENIK